MKHSSNYSPVDPSPSQGVGKAGRSRFARTEEIASSNLAALTTLTPLTIITAASQRRWS